MKRSIKYVFLLLGIFFVYKGNALMGHTYSTDGGLTSYFFDDNINELNLELKNIIDIDNPYYIDEIVDENGNVPAYEYYPTEIPSRAINDLVGYDGKIFMGFGDYDKSYEK